MALQGSGQISMAQIRNEFGPLSGQVSLGAYRVSQSFGNLFNLPLDTGIPQSGSIRLSNFYGKRLNVVVNLWSGVNNLTRLSIRSRYNQNFVNVVGGFRSRPASSAGIRVIGHINQTIGSGKGDRRTCAVRSGGWDANTTLQVDIGTSGYVVGSGGDGGRGGSEFQGTPNGFPGAVGTSALGLQYPAAVVNRGYLACGFGGGGGGGCGSNDPDKNRRDHGAAGGGGGGGAGYPAGVGGAGGAGGVVGIRPVTAGSPGSGGSFFTRGGGGAGANNSNAVAGAGGAGGDRSVGSAAGGGGRGNTGPIGSGGGAGINGHAIICNPGVTYSLSNSGTFSGGIVADTVL